MTSGAAQGVPMSYIIRGIYMVLDDITLASGTHASLRDPEAIPTSGTLDDLQAQ